MQEPRVAGCRRWGHGMNTMPSGFALVSRGACAVPYACPGPVRRPTSHSHLYRAGHTWSLTWCYCARLLNAGGAVRSAAGHDDCGRTPRCSRTDGRQAMISHPGLLPGESQRRSSRWPRTRIHGTNEALRLCPQATPSGQAGAQSWRARSFSWRIGGRALPDYRMQE